MRRTASEIVVVQQRLTGEASASFTTGEVEHLKVLIRLVLEFEPAHFVAPDIDCEYEADSIFSGVESFQVTTVAYRVLSGSPLPSGKWSASAEDAHREFDRLRSTFEADSSFPLCVGLLLEMFRLALLLAIQRSPAGQAGRE